MADVLSPAQPSQLYSVPGVPNYVASIPGGGVGAVTSVFGRVGAVVAQAGDYDSGQITNASGVAGATVTAALNTLNATATQLVTNLVQGQVPDTNGIAGQALLATATGTTWDTNFQAQNITTTGFVAAGGANPALSGALRIPYATALVARNQANAGDRTVVSFGVTGVDMAVFGDAAAGTYRILSSGQQDAFIGVNRQYSLGVSLINLRPDSQVSFDITLTASPMIGFNAGSSIRNLAFFAVSTTNFNTGNRIFYALTATAAPNAVPAGGVYFYVDPTTNAFQWITPAGTMPIGTTNFATTVVGTVGSALVGTANCLRWDTNKLGLYNTAPVVQQTATGSRGGNAALASLLTALATLGAIIDGTGP